MFIATDATELIGKTPMLQLNRVFPDSPARILAKFEAANPTSIKDRGMLSIIRKAMAEGRVRDGTEVVEATSGNSGIASIPIRITACLIARRQALKSGNRPVAISGLLLSG